MKKNSKIKAVSSYIEQLQCKKSFLKTKLKKKKKTRIGISDFIHLVWSNFQKNFLQKFNLWYKLISKPEIVSFGHFGT